MPCYHPMRAFRTADGSVVFHEKARFKIEGELTLPCGQCIGCRLERSRQWAIRCVHESKMHKANSFITLTYNHEHLPRDLSLDYSHFQLFMKRLRKRFPGAKIRFYMCGEYGENLGRPHFHAIMFNFPLRDKKPLFACGGKTYYTSDMLQRFWSVDGDPIGHVMTTGVSFASAQYVARYVTKKINGKKSDAHYTVMICGTGEIVRLKSEYYKCSTSPGIGSSWFDKYALTDLFPKDYVNVLTSDGPFKVAVPRYYMKKLEKCNPDLYMEIKARRLERARELAPDNTPERLLAKEKVVLDKARERLLCEGKRRYKGYENKNLQYIRLEGSGI